MIQFQYNKCYLKCHKYYILIKFKYNINSRWMSLGSITFHSVYTYYHMADKRGVKSVCPTSLSIDIELVWN
jgi:hypothetical protein